MLSWLSKPDFENLFSSCHEVNFRKKAYFSHFSHNFSKNNDIISDVIIPITEILKNVFHHFFSNIRKYDCAEFYVKSIFLSGFMLWTGGTMYTPRGMIRQKHPGADRVKKIYFIRFFGCF